MNTYPTTPDTIVGGATILRAGGLVAFPTETVYGLGADATQPKAVARLFKAKGRPSFNPLIIHVGEKDWVNDFSTPDSRFQQLSQTFWPGPLTLVLKQRDNSAIASLATAGLPSVAVRCPSHEIANVLLNTLGRPLAAPSANRSGSVSPTLATHVAESLGNTVDLIIDGGPCSVGIESTVLDLTRPKATILRPGAITLEQIRSSIGSVTMANGATKTPKSPGQMLSHYAPKLPLRLKAKTAETREALLGFGPTAAATLNLSDSGDLAEAAANLFAMLHLLDDPHSFKSIAVATIPETGLGIAINDRLRRAAFR